VIFHIIFY